MNLLEWCLQNDAQELLACYLNGGNPLPPEKIGFSSGKVVRWKCPTCGLSWESNPNHMNRRRAGRRVCPYCARERASYFYNVALLYPELAPCWDPAANKLPLDEYAPGSKYKAAWVCEKGHCWTRPICDQVAAVRRRRKGADVQRISLCPYCANQRASVGYNLELMFPELSLEWDYSRNGALVPREVMPYSSQKAAWVCRFDPAHKWTDRISNRTVLLRGCPICAKKFHTSYTARTLCYYLRRNDVECILEKSEGPYHIDIALESAASLPVALEIDSHYIHQTPDAQVRDKNKDIYLQNRGYRVIRVREDPAYTGAPMLSGNTIRYPCTEQYEALNALSEFIVVCFAGQKITADHIRDHWEIERMFYHDRKLRSLAVKYPHLAAQWSPDNRETPDLVLPGSSRKVLWICPDCHRQYPARVVNRTTHKSGCPYCAGRRSLSQTQI